MEQLNKFGEKVELPSHYDSFWKEYQQALAGGKLNKEDKSYFSQRIGFLLPDVGMIKESNKEKVTLATKLSDLPVIHDTYTYHYNRDDAYGEQTILTSTEKETIISLRPEIETVLYAEEISRYRRISPSLEPIVYYDWLNASYAGNPNKVGVLLDLFDEYYASREKQWQEHCIQGNELISIPSPYPIEKDIAALYEKIGRGMFDVLAQRYFDLSRVLDEARKIDLNAVAWLRKGVDEQYRTMREEMLAQL